jgi:uncharacterized repeat protein (TIGR02543 family)
VTVPGEGTYSYDVGTVVDLVAAADTGYEFVNWTGDTSTLANVNAASTTITMNGDYSITANFTLEPQDSPPTGGGGGGGGGGGTPTPTAAVSVTDVSLVITRAGVLTADVTATSDDGKVDFTMNRGTTAKTSDDEPIDSITVAEMLDPPAPAHGSSVVGLTYDMGPDGATFDPPITVTFAYDPDEVPEGVNEADLVIAVWDEDTGLWNILEGATADPATHTITTPVSHFSLCTILAYTRPATFISSALTVSAAAASVGETVTINLLITNTGNLRGSHTVDLLMNGESVSTKEIPLAGGASETVTFSTSADAVGEYRVAVGDQYGSLTVSELRRIAEAEMSALFATSNLLVSPGEISAGESITVSIEVTNTGSVEGTYMASLKINGAVERAVGVTLAAGATKTIEFAVSEHKAGSYEAEIDGLKGEYRVLPQPPAIGLPLLLGVIAAVVAVCIAILLFVKPGWVRG